MEFFLVKKRRKSISLMKTKENCFSTFFEISIKSLFIFSTLRVGSIVARFFSDFRNRNATIEKKSIFFQFFQFWMNNFLRFPDLITHFRMHFIVSDVNIFLSESIKALFSRKDDEKSLYSSKSKKAVSAIPVGLKCETRYSCYC
jgi:hypothetical protein